MNYQEKVNEIETEFLGTVILHPDTLPPILATMRDQIGFHHPKHEKVWQAVLKLYDENISIDQHEVARGVDLEDPHVTVINVVDAGVSRSKAQYLASKICEFNRRRKLQQLGHELNQVLKDPESSNSEISEKFHQISEVISQDRAGGEIIAASEIIDETVLRVKGMGDEDNAGLDTGFPFLNTILKGGFKNGNLYVLAGITSHGKTALSLNFVEEIAISNKIPVLFITMELSPIELGERLVYSIANVRNDLPKDHVFEDDETESINHAAGRIAEAPLYFVRYSDIHIAELRSRLKEAVKVFGIKIVVIDHLLKMDGGNAIDTRARQVSMITEGLHRIAREFDIPVLALCQLNRKASTENRLPQLSDLKDSSSIEQDAQVVMFIHRLRNDNGELGSDAKLKVDKNTFGRTAVIELVYMGEYFKFGDEDFKHER